MKKIMKTLKQPVMIVACLLAYFSGSQIGAQELKQFGSLKPGPYGVGYQVVSTYDYSRTFNTPKYDYEGEFQVGERARPINISIWYPAKKTIDAQQAMYETYFYPSFPEGEAISEQQKIVARQGIKNSPLAQRVEEDKFNELMMTRTAVVQSPEAQSGFFPLIVFAQGFGQIPSAHSILCEHLASHGFIIATSRSVGAKGGMTFDLLGAETQARDLEFIVGYMRDFPNIDKDKLGVIGFSFGGIAGAIVMMRNTDVDAFVSLDSAIGFSDGFSILFQSANYNASGVRAAVMHLMADPPTASNPNLNYFESLKYANTYLLKLNDLRHFDFSSWGKLSNMVPNFAPFAGEIRGDVDLGQVAVGEYVRHFLDAYVKRDESALAFLKNKPEENNISGDFLVVQVNESLNPPPSENDISSMINSGRIDEVVEIYREFSEKDPELEIFQENTLNNLGYQLLGQQRLEEAIDVFELNVEAYPDSWNVYDSLGEAYSLNGDTELAIKNYNTALEMNPGDQRIIGVLENFKATQ